MRSRSVCQLVSFLAVCGGLATGCSPGEPAADRSGTTIARGCVPESWASRYALVGSALLCAGCDPDCRTTLDRPDQNDLDTNPNLEAAGVVYDTGAGGVVIGSSSGGAKGLYAWISNSWESTVTKVTLEAPRTVVGVYRVGLKSQHNLLDGNWDWGNRPSRTAVDSDSNAYVLSRGLEGGWTVVTKIAGDHADCPDLNASLSLESSAGLGDIRGWPGDPDQDECILWNVMVGNTAGGHGRAIAIDAMGRLWVGLHSHRRFHVLDQNTGAELAQVSVTYEPYGAAIAPDGTLWYADHTGSSGIYHIQSIDTTSATPTDADVGSTVNTPNRPYGIITDQYSRVFVADKDHGGVNRFDPSTGTWISGNDPACSTSSGIALSAEGYVYASCMNSGGNRVSIYDSETLAVLYSYYTESGGQGVRPWGVCADFAGNVWAANFGSPDVTVLRAGVGVIDRITVQGMSYTYSDYTGYSNMTFISPAASLTRDYDAWVGCGSGAVARRYALRYQADFPGEGELHFYGRAADDTITLAAQPEVDLGSHTAPLGVVPIDSVMDAAGQPTEVRFFQIRIELIRGSASPVLREYVLEEYCE